MAESLQNFKKKLMRALGPSLGILACAYFAYHTVHGDRGLSALIVLQDQVSEAQEQADALQQRRQSWEHRVGLMSGKSLDLDMLEERARVMLNVGFERDYVIFLDGGES